MGLMQTVLLSYSFGAMCAMTAMTLWVAVSASATMDEMTRHAGKRLPPEGP